MEEIVESSHRNLQPLQPLVGRLVGWQNDFRGDVVVMAHPRHTNFDGCVASTPSLLLVTVRCVEPQNGVRIVHVNNLGLNRIRVAAEIKRARC